MFSKRTRRGPGFWACRRRQAAFAGAGRPIGATAGLALRKTGKAPKRHAVSLVALVADQIIVAEHVSPVPERNLRCRPLAARACQLQIPRSPALNHGSEPAHDHLPVNPAATLPESLFPMNASFGLSTGARSAPKQGCPPVSPVVRRAGRTSRTAPWPSTSAPQIYGYPAGPSASSSDPAQPHSGPDETGDSTFCLNGLPIRLRLYRGQDVVL
jgi:hypothetical protein